MFLVPKKAKIVPKAPQNAPKMHKKGSKGPLWNEGPYVQVDPLKVPHLPSKTAQNEIRYGKTCESWNGKRGFVKDVACVWVCPACFSTALFLLLGFWPALGNAKRIREKPRGRQKTHQATPREPKSHPRAAQKTTLGHQGAPKRHPTHPKGRQRDTKRPP